MRWEEERYVRVYTRDTLTWQQLGWEGQAALSLLFRKVDRAGLLEINEMDPSDALAAATGLPADVALTAWVRLSAGKNPVVTQRDDPSRTLFIPNFLPAQEAKQNDKARAAKHREMVRARALLTSRDETSQGVMERHTGTRPVTLSCAVLSRAEEPKDLSGSLTRDPTIGAEGCADVARPEANAQQSLTPEAAPESAEEKAVFAHWLKVLKKRADSKFSRERKAKIRARLKVDKFTVEQLCKAIDGVLMDPWEGRRGQDDLTIVLRDATQVEKFLALAEGRNPPPAKAGQANVKAVASQAVANTMRELEEFKRAK